jgi:pSer/pThr/pTyr-binding forkhead associated (FHA) protein
MVSKKYNLTEFREIHSETLHASFLDAFSEPFLVVTSPQSANPLIFPLPNRSLGTELYLGSSPGSEILLKSDKVSPRHLRFFFHEILNSWCIEDQETQNGTILDGKPVSDLSVHTLHEESLLLVDEFKIQIYPVSRMADFVFAKRESQRAQRKRSKEAKKPTTRMAPRTLNVERRSLGQIKKFLDVLTGNRCQTMLLLTMESQYMDDEEFLEKYSWPFLVLEKVVMSKDRPPLYKKDWVGADVRPIWALKPGAPITMGRSKSCIVFLQAKVVSKVHGRFVSENSQWILQDCDSVNRLYVNDRALAKNGSQILKDTDTISVSPHIILKFLSPKSILKVLTSAPANFDF